MEKEIFYIEESQTWICPEAGRYKVICVGGGASGSYTFPKGTVSLIQGNGGTTSFGAILSAAGGVIPESGGFPGVAGASATTSSVSFCSGENGYDGTSYGGSCSIGGGANSSWGVGGNARLSTQARGYGASGGASTYGFVCVYSSSGSSSSSPTTVYVTPFTTPCGEIKSTIVDLEEGQNVFCTVGKGGVPVPLEGTPLLAALKEVTNGAISITTTTEGMLKTVASGKDGVIIIQYLGA